MLKVIKLEVSPLKSNCYIVHEKNSEDCLIIDPGGDAEYIKDTVLRNNLAPTQIIATHGHFDHIGAALDLQLSFNIPFLIHKDDEFLLSRMRESSIHFTGIDPGPPPRVSRHPELVSGSEIKLNNIRFKIILTPGHTPGSVCLYHKPTPVIASDAGARQSKPHGILFVGDLIFFEERGSLPAGRQVGRTDFAYSDKSQLDESIHRILKLPQNTLCYSGHGEPFTINDFRHSWTDYPI
jgi:glyoxylase-like metal-dependent hydrolase (beta-lactamase superfamily II)